MFVISKKLPISSFCCFSSSFYLRSGSTAVLSSRPTTANFTTNFRCFPFLSPIKHNGTGVACPVVFFQVIATRRKIGRRAEKLGLVNQMHVHICMHCEKCTAPRRGRGHARPVPHWQFWVRPDGCAAPGREHIYVFRNPLICAGTRCILQAFPAGTGMARPLHGSAEPF